MQEPKPFSAEAERLYDEYVADGAPGSWQSWLLAHEDRLVGAPARGTEMFEVYLTDISSDGRAADLLTVADRSEAHELCVTLQGYLREGIEAHFVSAS
jgi:hypothetical protein